MMSPTCFEAESSSSGRLLYILIQYSVFYVHQYLTHLSTYKTAYTHTLQHTCIYNRLPEDVPSVSKHVEDIQN